MIYFRPKMTFLARILQIALDIKYVAGDGNYFEN